MASEQIKMHVTVAKVVAETTRVVIHTMAATAAERPQSTAGPKIGGPAMKQPTFNWETEDKYSNLKTFRLEINNSLSTCNTPEAEQLVMVKNWLGRRGVQCFEMLMNKEKNHMSHIRRPI